MSQPELPLDPAEASPGAPGDGEGEVAAPPSRPEGRGDLEGLRRAGVLAEVDVRAARVISGLTGERDPAVVLAAALTVHATRAGHVCLRLDDPTAGLQREAAQPPAPVELPDPDGLADRLEASPAVARADGDDAPLRLEHGRLYLERYWRYEQRLAARLATLAARRPDDLDPVAAEQALARLYPGADPDDPQRQAVATVAERGLTVCSGGPGTGKTTTVVRMLALLLEAAPSPPRVVLAAPTGKAAARLGDAVREALAEGALPVGDDTRRALQQLPTMTLHRLLGWQRHRPSRFRHHAERPVPYDVVVVDETSMASLALTAKLVDAVADDARLVLVGDRDQLASVDAGAVLGDICGPRGIEAPDAPLAGSVVQLTRFHRFAADSGIGRMAREVQRDALDPEALVGALADDPTGDARVVAPADGGGLPDGVLDEVLAGYREVVSGARDGVAPAELLARLDRQRVLCATRVGPDGVLAVNQRIEQALARQVPGYDPSERYPLGRPVLVTANDYAVRLFNGDVGLVVADPDRPQQRQVAFAGEDGVRLVAPARLPAHEPVWAMSVHKSQGSQFDRVVISLPRRDAPVCTRELVYTAVTRARRQATLVASRELLVAALHRRAQRASGLQARLWGIGQPPGGARTRARAGANGPGGA